MKNNKYIFLIFNVISKLTFRQHKRNVTGDAAALLNNVAMVINKYLSTKIDIFVPNFRFHTRKKHGLRAATWMIDGSEAVGKL